MHTSILPDTAISKAWRSFMESSSFSFSGSCFALGMHLPCLCAYGPVSVNGSSIICQASYEREQVPPIACTHLHSHILVWAPDYPDNSHQIPWQTEISDQIMLRCVATFLLVIGLSISACNGKIRFHDAQTLGKVVLFSGLVPRAYCLVRMRAISAFLAFWLHTSLCDCERSTVWQI